MKLNKLVSTLNMEHEEWLENRRKGIGGSDAGSICGLNPYSSAIAVFQDKTQPLTEKRKITVMIEFKPNEARNFVTTGVQAKATLAPALGAVTALSMGKNLKTNEVEAYEVGSQIPGQITMEETLEATEEMEDGRVVDKSTGEIYETPAKNVVDLRAVRQA